MDQNTNQVTLLTMWSEHPETAYGGSCFMLDSRFRGNDEFWPFIMLRLVICPVVNKRDRVVSRPFILRRFRGEIFFTENDGFEGEELGVLFPGVGGQAGFL